MGGFKVPEHSVHKPSPFGPWNGQVSNAIYGIRVWTYTDWHFTVSLSDASFPAVRAISLKEITEDPKPQIDSGYQEGTRVQEDMVNRVLGRSFGEWREVFLWLSGFISEKEIRLKIRAPRRRLYPTPLTVYIALCVHYLIPSSQLSEKRR